MVFCGHCQDDCPYVKDPDNGIIGYRYYNVDVFIYALRSKICCGICGKVLDPNIYDDGPSFVKDSSGQSRLRGSIIKAIEDGCSISRERTEAKGRDEIWQIVHGLHLALDNSFTKGRQTSHVAAACLYIACRDYCFGIDVSLSYMLCQVLLLGEHPIVQKLVDPSLFIHRFTERLLGKRNNAVSDTALCIVASMKRDWMQASCNSCSVLQTGRKPSGLCGAALYIAALSHGYDYTKADIAAVVHVCEATLFKRLIEFESTDSGSLTVSGPFVIAPTTRACALGDQQLNMELQRKAMSKLVGIKFTFRYKRGTENGVADALSRVGHLLAHDTLSLCHPHCLQEVAKSYDTHTDGQELLT
uniref:Transcription factor IIIB 90 kDa subunit n=1 Tax=Aegilops tauschii TaxID=37682 RepID=N1QZG5_AEGTA